MASGAVDAAVGWVPSRHSEHVIPHAVDATRYVLILSIVVVVP